MVVELGKWVRRAEEFQVVAALPTVSFSVEPFPTDGELDFARRSVRHGVTGPDRTHTCPRRPLATPAPTELRCPDGEAFLAIEAVDPVDARRFAFAPQQDEQPPVAEATPLIGELAQAKGSMIAWRGLRGP